MDVRGAEDEAVGLLDDVAEAVAVGVAVRLAVASVISQHTPASVGQHGTSSSSPLAVTRTQAASSSKPGWAVAALGSPAAHSAAPSLENKNDAAGSGAAA